MCDASLCFNTGVRKAVVRILVGFMPSPLGYNAGMLPLAFALGAGSQMLQPLAIAVIGGLVISMALSLVVTPLVYFLLTRHRVEALSELP